MTWFPENVSTTGFLIDNLFYFAFALLSATFAIVLGLLLYFLIRYRNRPGLKSYYTKGDSPKALMLTLVLALTVFVVLDINLAIHDHDAWKKIWAKPDLSRSLEIRIRPQQFVWNAQYAGLDHRFDTPDDVNIQNDLHIPVNHPIFASLQSKDVIHCFFLPQFRIKQDVMPVMTTHLSFEAVKTGVFEIACAQHCGLGHYRMRGVLTVESEEMFRQWLQKNAGSKEIP